MCIKLTVFTFADNKFVSFENWKEFTERARKLSTTRAKNTAAEKYRILRQLSYEYTLAFFPPPRLSLLSVVAPFFRKSSAVLDLFVEHALVL